MKLKKIFAGMAASAIAMTTFAMAASAVELKENEKETPNFNLLLITTDIEDFELVENDEGEEVPMVNGTPVVCKDVTIAMGSNTYNMDVALHNNESKYLQFMIVNTYNNEYNDEYGFEYVVPGEGDTLSIDFTLEGMGDVSGNAGIAFQTAETWNFRDPADKSGTAAFPAKAVGVQGAGYGYDTAVDCTDVVINGDGSYSVSIACSGTINDSPEEFDDGSVREGYAAKWAMNKSYEPQAEDASSNTSGADSKNDSKTDSKADSKTDSKADSSSKKDTTTSNKSNTNTNNKTNSTAASSTAASDNTNSETGATAGIALAGITLAGAAIVVAKRK